MKLTMQTKLLYYSTDFLINIHLYGPRPVMTSIEKLVERTLHTHTYNLLSNVKVFLLMNTISKILLLDPGIIHNFKRFYCRNHECQSYS